MGKTQIKIQLIDKNSKIPERQTKLSSGYDAFVRDFKICSKGRIFYYLGFKTEIPPHMEGHVLARSSITKTDFVPQNGEGLIDADYRGEWQFRIKLIPSSIWDVLFPKMMAKKKMPYKIGDRCCQIFFKGKNRVQFVETDLLSQTERNGGFGSTGK